MARYQSLTGGPSVTSNDWKRLGVDLAPSGGSDDCACCFSTFPSEDAIKCGDAHSFCKACVAHFAESEIGERR